MIILVGDIHGDASILHWAIERAHEKGASAVIQVGDFGLFNRDGINIYFRRCIEQAKIPVYFVEGNHDDCVRWTQLKEVTKVWEDRELYYVPRGTVMEIDGRTIAFMGGAGSIDKDYRLRQRMHWDEHENINEEEVARLLENVKGKKIDMFITHCPPNTVIDEHFDPRNKLFFGVGIDWKDPNQDIIENLWKALDYPYIYSGHMHRSVVGMTYRILDINEMHEV